MVNFLGSSEHTLDDKGRLILPQRIVGEVPQNHWNFRLTAGLDRCLLLHSPAGWQELLATLGRAVPGSRAHRALCRRFLGHSEEVVPDGNRRIRLPEPLLQYAGITAGQPVVLVGMGQVVEIWSAAQLNTSLVEATEEEELLFASMVGPTKTSTSCGGA